jgi:hypothetical protein
VGKDYRYCTINPIRKEVAGEAAGKKMLLTVDELKALSNEEVVEILSSRHSLSGRQRELLKELMVEVQA